MFVFFRLWCLSVAGALPPPWRTMAAKGSKERGKAEGVSMIVDTGWTMIDYKYAARGSAVTKGREGAGGGSKSHPDGHPHTRRAPDTPTCNNRAPQGHGQPTRITGTRARGTGKGKTPTAGSTPGTGHNGNGDGHTGAPGTGAAGKDPAKPAPGTGPCPGGPLGLCTLQQNPRLETRGTPTHPRGRAQRESTGASEKTRGRQKQTGGDPT
eukprot:gene24299-biopygen10427